MHCFIISSELKLARHWLNLVYMYVHQNKFVYSDFVETHQTNDYTHKAVLGTYK